MHPTLKNCVIKYSGILPPPHDKSHAFCVLMKIYCFKQNNCMFLYNKQACGFQVLKRHFQIVKDIFTFAPTIGLNE